jgi:hypothetical protein
MVRVPESVIREAQLVQKNLAAQGRWRPLWECIQEIRQDPPKRPGVFKL